MKTKQELSHPRDHNGYFTPTGKSKRCSVYLRLDPDDYALLYDYAQREKCTLAEAAKTVFVWGMETLEGGYLP